MRTRWLIAAVIVAFAACGRIDFDPLAPPPIGPRCGHPAVTAPVRLAGTEPFAQIAAVALGSTIAVAWPSPGDLTAATLSADATGLASMTSLGPGHAPQLAAGDDDFGIVFLSGAGPPETASFQRLDKTASPLAAATVLSMSSEVATPSVASNGTEWAVSWAENFPRFGVFVQLFDAAGAAIAPEQNANNAGDCLCPPSLAWSGGSAGVSFANDGWPNIPQQEVGFDAFDASDTPLLAAPIPLTADPANVSRPLEVATTDGFAIAYSRAAGDLYPVGLVTIDSTGGVVQAPTNVEMPTNAAPIALVPVAGGFIAGAYAVASDASSGSLTVTWLAADGTVLDGSYELANEPGSYTPALVVLPDRIVAIFGSSRDGTDAVYVETLTCE
jgi:hypothetical protein